jgi:hypothetical protein
MVSMEINASWDNIRIVPVNNDVSEKSPGSIFNVEARINISFRVGGIKLL